ncbi:hypothetical protein HHI36_016474 [Cryptolaemus montrouzieri]|uniref:Uncharacterized protein n=1 Tax=Cryptolaemus montrouzieri TaxID=559131 RepID=A0ABD2NJL0_9CUCU
MGVTGTTKVVQPVDDKNDTEKTADEQTNVSNELNTYWMDIDDYASEDNKKNRIGVETDDIFEKNKQVIRLPQKKKNRINMVTDMLHELMMNRKDIKREQRKS